MIQIVERYAIMVGSEVDSFHFIGIGESVVVLDLLKIYLGRPNALAPNGSKFGVILLSSLVASTTWGQDQNVVLYPMIRPPLVLQEPDAKGVVGDMVYEALKRLGKSPRVVVEPPIRAMRSVRESKDALIIPLARLADREPHYTWIFPAYEVQRAFFSISGAASTFDEARTRYPKIAVQLGTAAETILLEQGFSSEQLVRLISIDSAPQMLLKGRVDAWYNWVPETEVLIKRHDPEGKIKRGAILGSTVNYVACSLQCDPELVAGLRKTLEKMKRSGELEKISQRYVN